MREFEDDMDEIEESEDEYSYDYNSEDFFEDDPSDYEEDEEVNDDYCD